jgi:hypothetical protein
MICSQAMTIEAIEKSGLLGLKKHCEKVIPGTKYFYTSGELETTVEVMSDDKISICDTSVRILKMKYLNEDRINKANLIIPRIGKSPIHLNWKNIAEIDSNKGSL